MLEEKAHLIMSCNKKFLKSNEVSTLGTREKVQEQKKKSESHFP